MSTYKGGVVIFSDTFNVRKKLSGRSAIFVYNALYSLQLLFSFHFHGPTFDFLVLYVGEPHYVYLIKIGLFDHYSAILKRPVYEGIIIKTFFFENLKSVEN